MKEYRCMKIKVSSQETAEELNKLAREGWKVICSYSWNNNFIVLERDRIK